MSIRGEDITPNGEATPAQLPLVTLNDGTPAATITLTGTNAGNPSSLMLQADNGFVIGRTLPTTADNPVIPAGQLYYHPVRGATRVVVKQATAGQTVHLRMLLFGTSSNPAA